MDYVFERADSTGAGFRTHDDDRLMKALPFAAAAVLLLVFAVQTVWTGEATDRLAAVVLFALALGTAGGGLWMWRRPGPPPVLRFDNVSRTLRFEDARGMLVSGVPYADVGPFEAGKYSSTSNGTSYTTYTIGVTLPDGRRLRLCRDTEAVRDEQLAQLRRCVTLPHAESEQGAEKLRPGVQNSEF
ncbi:hypothetical protein [Luteitalea sp.]|uniref:hypothetical protein n=1 Tax=Luteitalea sp. TaxID=2004800 RepID=UPI0037C7D893